MRRPILTGVAVGLALVALLDAALVRLDLPGGIVPRLEGPAAWLASRSAGITAYVALSLDVVFGLFVSTGAADAWLPRARSLEIHRWLSGATLGLVVLHALVLLLDRTGGLDLLELVLPGLASYRPLALAAGILAFAAALLVRESFAWRSRIGARTWRRLHALSFVAYALATAHGITAGTDSGTTAMLALYLSSTLAVLGLLAVRFTPRPTPARRAPAVHSASGG